MTVTNAVFPEWMEKLRNPAIVGPWRVFTGTDDFTDGLTMLGTWPTMDAAREGHVARTPANATWVHVTGFDEGRPVTFEYFLRSPAERP